LGFLGSTADNQHINVSQGYVQGGFGSGSVGTNKAPSLNTTEFYDLTQGGTLPLAGYAGGVFDGRYIYYVPYLNNGNSHGTVARYDTLFPFTAPSSYRFFDLTQLNANAVQFVGGLYDGRYIYFIPYGLSFNHYFIQYDTTLSFTAFGSYSIFDLSVFGISSIVGFGGGAFDGRYIYLAPTWNGGGSGQEVNTTIMRYDSTQPFIASSSYSTFNTQTIDPTQTSFFGATFDGQYIYFIPYNSVSSSSGSVTRYDTALPFSKSTSYSIFNLQAINSICKQYYGGLFDGRYVYYIPNSFTHLINTLFIRYDTYLPFSAVSSYTAFNLLSVDPTNTYQAGGVFDGRYIYFGHFGQSPDLGSTIIRYDTTRPFNSPNSYTCLGVGQAINYRGVVTDGRYIYFVPSDNKFSDPNASSSGTIVRIDAYPGPQATAMIASQAPNGFAIGSYAGNITPYAGENAPLYGNLIVGGRVGVNTATPQFDMDVNGTINVSQTFLTGVLGSTIDNQNINIAEGNNQGGLGGGSVGTNKALSLATTAFYDLTQGNTQPLSVFGAGVFDGRYIYFVPAVGTVARYDTSLPFSSSGSYSAYNLTKLNALAQGFWGGLYDGQYVYFLPIGNSIAPVIVQYNTALSFNSAASYTVFALTSIGVPSNAGYGGGVFDGRYIYLSPATGASTPPRSATIVRYDTTSSFTTTGSYSTFNIQTIATGLTHYFGAVYDGRYVYFMPYNALATPRSASIMRYDTTLPFSAASSYAVYDMHLVSSKAQFFYGGVFDGRYVYLIPAERVSFFTRYDTMQTFQSAGSYTTFDLTLVDPSNTGQYGGIFDGRYIYMGHETVGVESLGATIIRYDTTLPFNAPGSYTCLGTGQTLSYRGCVFDGHYVYFVPAAVSGTVVRIDAYPGPQATAMAAYQAPNGFVVGDYVGSAAAADGGLLVSDNMGIGTNNPQYTLDVNGTMQTIAITPINTQPVYANGATTNNQLITLAEGYNQGFGSGSVGTNKQMSINGSAVYDTLPVTGSTVGYTGAVFDGRYVYLIPGNAVYLGSPNPSTLTRYDTTLPLSSAGSYTSFNLLRIHSTCVGYLGGAFDGRYVYLTPYNTATITRYDTYQNFNAVSSYTTCNLLNAGMSGTLSGAAFDGRYIYFSALTAVMARFDTTLPFNSPNSYDSKLLPSYTGSNFNKFSFGGCIYDGRYVYLAPTRNVALNSTIFRYDTALPFLSADSYTWFDLRTLTATPGGLGIGTFDGRYVYFMSNIGLGFSLDSSTIVRYDTQQSFLLAGSYTIFNTLQVHPSPIIFSGAVFDGRYVYFTPAYTSSATVVIRYDTTLRFNAAASYTALSTMTISTQSRGFSGGVFDGQYVYLTPYSTSSLTRIDAYPGPQATAIAASQAPNGFAVGNYAGTTAANGNLIISGNFGIGTSTPTYSLQLGVGTSAKPGVNGTWINPSDVRIKTNIQDVSDSLNLIRQLRPRKYRFRPEYAKDIQADPNAFYYGFVADEVEGVIDGCVSTSGIHCFGGQAASSEPLPDLMNLKTLNIHNILVHSIHAIKELADRGDQLKQQIDGLNN